MNSQRHLRIATIASIFLFLVLAGFALFAGTTNSIAARGNTGKALAIQTLLASDKAKLLAASSNMAGRGVIRGADGRYLMDPSLLRPSAYKALSHLIPNVAPVTGPVQTFDTFAPADSFTTFNSQPRVTKNLFPVWTNDEQFILFSSNRDADGKILGDGTLFHIWGIPATGGQPFQITTSTAQTGRIATTMHGELYPALSPGDNSLLAFTSDANLVNHQHLYAIPFSPGQTVFNVTGVSGPSAFQYSLTQRSDVQLDFDNVTRPTFGGDGQIAFAGHTIKGTYAGRNHIYILNFSTHGYAQSIYPAKLTNGPADDGDPAWSPDGQFIAFDSTATGLTSTGQPISPGVPGANGGIGTLDVSPVLTTAGATLHNIFMLRSSGAIPPALISGNGAGNGLMTKPGNDDIDPAWSSGAANPYSNPRGDAEYLAFSRATSATQPHNIFYFPAESQVFTADNESGSSNGVRVIDVPAGGKIFQINAGGPAVAPYAADDPTAWSGGSVGTYPAGGPAINTAAEGDPAPLAVYQTYRTATTAAPTITRTFSGFVPGANYEVHLHFVEPTATAAGQRVFNVLLNGAPYLTNFDIFAVTGGQGVTDAESTGSVTADTNGQIHITFQSVTGLAIVSGIEIVSTGSGAVTIVGTSAANAPKNLTATLLTNTAVVQLNWDPAPVATSYNVYRQSPTDAAPILLATGVTALTYTDTTITVGQTYTYTVRAQIGSSSETVVTPESAGTAIKLNTQTSGAFDNVYPAWAPFITDFSIAYSSNRSVTYTAANGTPSQTDISLPRGNANPAIGSGYTGLLQSQVINVDPPILQRFNENEIVHINVGSSPILPSTANERGSATHNIVSGFPATFTVRMSDRVSGTSKVYIQIKDPDSKYQDDQGREHKRFVGDPNLPALYSNTSGTTNNFLWNGHGLLGSNDDNYGFQIFNGIKFYQSGVLAGTDDAGFNISIGKYTGPLMTKNIAGNLQRLDEVQDDSDPKNVLRGGKVVPNPLYKAIGAEYECEYINPTVLSPGSGATDYGTPFYLAGHDDRRPFTGDDLHPNSGKPRPTTGANAQWLPLTLSPVQDNKGGLLYSGTWTVPNNTVSDYYLDVIAYNAAVYPFPSTVNTSGFNFTQGNWRIYDNVWGCTSRSLDNSKDILVVSDNMLGQKFTGTSFGGHQRFLTNLRPVYFGGESYVTDIDASLLPDCAYYWDSKPSVYLAPIFIPPLNGLGVNSYFDGVIDDQARNPEGYPIVKSQQYAIWRTLCHDPIDSGVLSSFLTNTTSNQPAVTDTGLGLKVDAGNVAIATRCVLWFSPYTNDLFVGPGTLSDPSIQQALTDFTKSGGRLLVSGQDVASQNPGSTFVTSTLNATFVSDTGGGQHLSSGSKNIFGFNNSWISNDFRGQNTWRTDGSLSMQGPNPTPFFSGPNGSVQYVTGAIDAVMPNASASSDIVFAGSANSGIIYTETAANKGSRVVYASFGLEGLSQEVIKVKDGLFPSPRDFHFESLNYRTRTIHNIVSYLRTGSFTGSIKDTTKTGDQSVNGAIVYAVPVGGQLGTRAVYSATSVNGQYKIDGVPPGTYTIYAAKAGYQRAQSPQPVSVEGDVNVDIGLIISPLSDVSIKGQVTDALSGKPVSGATVTFTPEDDTSVSYSAQTNANGVYFIQHIPSLQGGRTYDGQASFLPGYPLSAIQKVTAAPGQNVDGTVTAPDANAANANFVLKPTPGTVTGRVYDSATNAGIVGAIISVTQNGVAIPTTATTTTNGVYTIQLGQGTYTLTAKAAGYTSKSRDNVVVVIGKTLSGQDFALDTTPPGFVGGLVTNTATGLPVPGISIKFTMVGSSTPTKVFVTSTTVTSPAAPQGDGKPLNYLGSLPEGDYTVTATDTTLGTAIPTPAGTITIVKGAFKRVDLTFALGTLGGLVQAGPNSGPLSGVTVTITTTDGTAVGTTTTGTISSPVAPAGDASLINYRKYLPAGDYLVTFSKAGFPTSPALPVTIVVGQFSRVDYTFPVVTSFPAGLQMISSPLDYTGVTLDTLFGTTRSKLVIWQPQLLQYVFDPTPPADTLHPGYGYWIRLPKAVDFTVRGTVPAGGSGDAKGFVPIALHPFWNQIGPVGSVPIPITSLKFKTANLLLSYADAISPQYALVSPSIYGYDQASNAYVKVTTLQPWKGYWIKVNSDTTVYIPIVNTATP